MYLYTVGAKGVKSGPGTTMTGSSLPVAVPSPPERERKEPGVDGDGGPPKSQALATPVYIYTHN